MKKIITFILTFFLTFFFSSSYIYAQSKIDTLVVHYFRYDNNYEDYNIWLWQNKPTSLEGIKFDFSNNNVDEYGAFIEIDLTKNYPDTTEFGIIVKKGNWGGYQEPGGDRFFQLDKMERDGKKVHSYIVEQDLNIGVSTEDLKKNIPNYQPKVLSSYFTKTKEMVATFSHDFESLKILENGIEIYSIPGGNKNIKTPILDVNLAKHYQLKVDFGNDNISIRDISIQNLYDTKEFEDAFTYDDQLGAIYSKNKTIFRLWAPISEKVTLNLYNQGHPYYDKNGKEKMELTPFETHELTKIENGAWEVIVPGDLANNYYTFSVTNYGQTHEVTDPYSTSTGANGLRSMITNFEELNPDGWIYNNRPDTIKNLTDYIVYELHVRDLTTHSSWNGNDDYRGKFLGFTQTGTTYEDNGITVTTGIDHISELGVNAVQLLPIFDFGYIDEVEMFLNQNYKNTFNWGYMPYHFNSLEGSYSTNPFNGGTRITEFKQLINALHEKDIRVIMDVVYNHTGESASSNFHKILPGYYHRLNESGGFSNGSGTGNETASERSMVRKFIVDSVKFLATEYNLSGFRFDLMKLHDVDTMLEIEQVLHEIDPTIVIYGEPWDAGGAALDEEISAGKENIKNLGTVGAFNDNMRDAIKGSVFNPNEGAWLQGVKPENHIENIKYGIVGGVDHDDVNVDKWHLSPERTINYVSAHDNNTLYDKLRLTGVRDKVEQMQVQANAIVLTSQGIPFIHAGAEFMRSKPTGDGGYDENSYESPDSVNQLRWDRKSKYNNVFEYYKTLIQIRKLYPQFRMTNSDDIKNYIKFINTNNPNVIAFKISNPTMPEIVVIHAGNVHGIAQVPLTSGKTYRRLTTLNEHSVYGLGSTIANTGFALANSTAILVENKPVENVSLKSSNISIEKNSDFNPLDNINYDTNKHQVFTSNFYDTSIPGNYLIKVTVIDSNLNISTLEFNLNVKGSKYPKVKLKGKITV